MPRISIITPLYNKVAYIQETMQSVLGQTMTDWEMLIIDNGSTDGSLSAAKEICDPRIKFFFSSRQGPGAARNVGLQQAQGEWLQFLDADDLLVADHLAQQLAAAARHPEAEIIVSCWQEFPDGQPDHCTIKRPVGWQQPEVKLTDLAIAFAPWADHAAIVKRQALSPANYWPEELDQYLAEDIAFWFKLLTQCQVAYGDSQGALYRLQTPQSRNQNLDPQKWFTGIHAAITRNQDYWLATGQSFTPGQCENLMRVYASSYLLAQRQQSPDVAQRSLALAKQWLQHYLRLSPSPKLSMWVRHLVGLERFLRWVQRA